MFNLYKTGASIFNAIYTFILQFLGGMNPDNMYAVYKKYGFWAWDMNAFFLFLPAMLWIPVGLFFSYKNLGKKLTNFNQEYMNIDILLSSRPNQSNEIIKFIYVTLF